MRKLLTVCLCGFCPGRLVQFVFDGGFAAEARRRVGWPCFVAGRSRGVACAALLRAGRSRPWGRVGVPTILRHFEWWRSLFGSASDEAVAGFQGRLRLVVG